MSIVGTNWKATTISQLMEDDLNFFLEMEDDLNFRETKDNLNFWETEAGLNFFAK
jgi:hypothetical protein